MDRRKRKLAAVALFALAVSGCVTRQVPASVPEARPLGREFPTFQAVDVETTREVTPPPAGPSGAITLRDALALALVNNPRLAAFSWEVRARDANVLQAGLLPNPEVTIEVENFGGSGATSGFDGAENTLWLSQLIELGGKRTKRREVAQFARILADWDYETARIDTFTEVALAFAQLLAAQERKTLSEELVGVTERAFRVVRDQVKAGAVSPVEKNRAEVALASSRVEFMRRARDVNTARKLLAATWGSTSPAFSGVTGTLDDGLSPPPSETALVRQVEANPELARWTAELSARRATVALEESRGIPDVTLGGGPRWFNETNDNAFVFALSVPLPLFDRNQGAALEARRRLIKASEERRAAEVDIKTALGTAYELLAATYDAVVALRTQVLPEAQAALDGATSAYRRGVFRYLDVLDAQRTLFALRSEYVDTLAAHHAAIARMERLVGRSLEEIRAENRKP